MRRALVVGGVLLAVGVAAAGAVLLLGEEGIEALPELNERGVAVTTVVAPREHLFGDEVSARVEVLVDRRRVDPEAVTVRPTFEPYEPVGSLRTERRDAGELTRLRFGFRLRCLDERCVELTVGEGFAFPPGAVRAGGEPVARFEWPELGLRSRVVAAGAEGSAGAWRVNVTEAPAPTYRVSPAVVVGLLAGLAGVFAAAGALLLVVAFRRAPRGAPRVPPLERALVLLDAARRRAEPEEERRALDLLAVELSRQGEGELARTASELAWARPRPASEATDRLAEQVGDLVVAGRNGRRA